MLILNIYLVNVNTGLLAMTGIFLSIMISRVNVLHSSTGKSRSVGIRDHLTDRLSAANLC